ncbi:hypothetical protein EDD18DRAFT_1110395 [Armillaria luteobubalina]|uniref:Uncharacterized protein n=1 Tax=Armillaria luteobubalina TaxID=153913 RepID=A0AA39PPP7_9AGAR|nr:hypothetical protein EDD18DRAFT_1110395 [Armillaria luteobubalina]
MFVITPNAKTVMPCPSLGNRKIYMRENYRYGFDDPLQWPQAFVPDYAHYACLRWRQPPVNDPLRPLYLGVTEYDWMRLCHAETQRVARELHVLVQYMSQYKPLMDAPESDAPPMPVDDDLIGTFSNDTTTVQSFFKVGIPVWRVIPIKDLPGVRVDNVCEFSNSPHPEEPSRLRLPTVFTGSSRDPRNISHADQKKQHIQSGASNRLQDLQHQLLPPIIEPWRLALLAVDASPTRCPLFAQLTIPELLPPNLYHQEWRTVLGMGFLRGDPASGTAAEKRRIEVRKMMDGFMEELPLHPDNAATSAFWHGKNYEALKQEECQEILWELAEVNFRSHSSSNVQNLPVMRCFPDGNHLPGQLDIGVANYGLADPLWLRRAPYIFAMKKAMRTWEDAPPLLLSEVRTAGWTEKDFLLVEKTVADYYCDTFWQYFGRAPVLPRQLRHQTSEDYVPEA